MAMSTRMAAVDAQFYWMSAKIGNDQFLLYVFDGEPADVEEAVTQVIRRARRCRDLGLRVEPDDLLLLVLDPARIGAEIKWEQVPGSASPFPRPGPGPCRPPAATDRPRRKPPAASPRAPL